MIEAANTLANTYNFKMTNLVQLHAVASTGAVLVPAHRGDGKGKGAEAPFLFGVRHGHTAACRGL